MDDLKKNEIYEADVTGFTSEGAGVCRISGRAVFVPRALPGERWRVRIVKVTKTAVYGRGEERLTSSPERVAPACPNFGRCGGCDLMHMSYAAELTMKLERVNEAFRRLGGLELRAERIIGSDSVEGYRNKAVYAMNRGGVTLTGGEPLLQAAFAAEVLAALQAAGVHTAVETSGYAAPDVFRRVAGHADLVLFDVKHADPVQHRRWTGVDNAPILRNLAWLCTSGRPFVVRIPLIPGVNDTRENMLQTCLLIKDAPGLERVEILRYHKTAGAKYAMIGRTYAPGFDTGAEPRVHDVFSDYNLKTLIQ